MTGKGTDGKVPLWADRLRRDRLARRLSVRDAVQQLRLAALVALPEDSTLERMWRRWESGEIDLPDPVYQRSIAAMFGSVPAAYFPPADTLESFVRLTDDQTAELIQRLRHSSVDQAAIDALDITVDQLCTDYASRPAAVVLSDARTWLETVNGLLGDRPTVKQHVQVLTMAGWLTLLVACLYHDVGAERAARAAQRSAMELAEEVNSVEIAAWTAEIRAWMSLTSGDNYAALHAARDGLERTSKHQVSVQLRSQAARAWGRIGNREEAFTEMRKGRELLSRLPFPENPRNHFQVDPTKWDFYAMDIWRLLQEDPLASEAAETVIKTSTSPDGRSISPMRLAEAKLTKAAILARGGDVDGALEWASDALDIDRRCLPSLLLTAREVGTELERIRPGDETVSDFVAHVQQLSIRG